MSCICVIGMHRSGTSCLTGIMQGLGIELGEVFTENEYNKKGNRENGRIVYLNDALLTSNGGAWNDPVDVTEWHEGHTDERDAIIAELSGRAASAGRATSDWGFKDPRTMFALDFWQGAIPDMKFIGTFRHPYRVARSLNNRDNTPLDVGMKLWLRYNLRLIELLHQYNFDIVDFDAEPETYLNDVIGKLVALGIEADRAEEARSFFDTSLRNQASASTAEVEMPPEVADVYQQLQEYHRRG